MMPLALRRRLLPFTVRERAISERIAGNGHGPRTDFGRTCATAALVLYTLAAWTWLLLPSATWLLQALIGLGFVLAYAGALRWTRRHLNWLELAPTLNRVPKSEIDGFINLSNLLTTVGGLSLLAAQPPLVGVCIGANVVVGLMIVDSSRRLRRQEAQRESVTYNVVNGPAYAVLRKLLLWQLRFLLIALALAVLARIGGGP